MQKAGCSTRIQRAQCCSVSLTDELIGEPHPPLRHARDIVPRLSTVSLAWSAHGHAHVDMRMPVPAGSTKLA